MAHAEGLKTLCNWHFSRTAVVDVQCNSKTTCTVAARQATVVHGKIPALNQAGVLIVAARETSLQVNILL